MKKVEKIAVNIAAIKFSNEDIKEAAKFCLDLGYRIFAAQNENISYFNIVDGLGNIGYIQANYYGGLDYSTVHKPCKRFGTGFGLNNGILGDPLSIDLIHQCLGLTRCWASYYKVEKFKDWNDYLNYPTNNILTYYEITL